MGSCSTITLVDSEFAQYLTIYYSNGPGPVVGLKITTSLGNILRLGNTEKSFKQYTFTFEINSLLVGFMGTMLDWQINSLGVIYLDPTCIPVITTPSSTNKAEISIAN